MSTIRKDSEQAPQPRQTVSVAMCTYNGQRFLPVQLASLLQQERLPDEVVICDDNSSDGTREILEVFATVAPLPVQIRFNAQRLGITKNFEQAISECCGDLIALSDQDDAWCSTKLRRLEELMIESPQAGYACSNAELIGDDGRRLGGQLFDQVRISPLKLLEHEGDAAGRELLLQCNVITGCTVMIRKSLWHLMSPIPSAWGHDYWLAVVNEILGHHGVVTNEALLDYRLHREQACGISKFGRFHKRQDFAARQLRRELRLRGLNDLHDHVVNRLLAIDPESKRWLPIIDQAKAIAENAIHAHSRTWLRRGWPSFFQQWLGIDERRAA